MKALVMGLGESAKRLDGYDYYIGVNDCRYKCDAIICVDPPEVFKDGRLKYMISDNTPMFTQVQSWAMVRENVKSIKLTNSRSDLTNIHLKQDYPHSITSPFVAVVHAYFMGATEIGINGVDLYNHKSLGSIAKINKVVNDFMSLRDELKTKGVRMYLATDMFGALSGKLEKG
jgi:hypothetical protein